MGKNETAAPATAEAVYTKEQLAGSKRYASRRDLLSALLEDGKTYTLTEVDVLMDKFLKGAVK